MVRPTVSAALNSARAVLRSDNFVVDEVALLLDGLLFGNFDTQIRDAILHARNVVGHENRTVSRFALARVVLLLEQHVKLRVVS